METQRNKDNESGELMGTAMDWVSKELGFPTAEGGFGTLVADPPWSFSDKGSRAAPDWKEHKLYETMTENEILRLPVDLLAAPKSHLYLWTTDTHLPLALEVMSAWGFIYKKVLAWVKRKSAVTPIRCDDGEDFQVFNGPLQIGMGHYYRSAKELCLFGTRGKCPANVHNLPDVFEAPRSQHSRKPSRIHEWAEQLSPGPRVELFARRSREGWDAWGDQFPGHDAYLRVLDKLTERYAGVRAVREAKHSQRRLEIAWDELRVGVSEFAKRCANCRRAICPGDGCHYIPYSPVTVCVGCVINRENEVPF